MELQNNLVGISTTASQVSDKQLRISFLRNLCNPQSSSKQNYPANIITFNENMYQPNNQQSRQSSINLQNFKNSSMKSTFDLDKESLPVIMNGQNEIQQILSTKAKNKSILMKDIQNQYVNQVIEPNEQKINLQEKLSTLANFQNSKSLPQLTPMNPVYTKQIIKNYYNKITEIPQTKILTQNSQLTVQQLLNFAKDQKTANQNSQVIQEIPLNQIYSRDKDVNSWFLDGVDAYRQKLTLSKSKAKSIIHIDDKKLSVFNSYSKDHKNQTPQNQGLSDLNQYMNTKTIQNLQDKSPQQKIDKRFISSSLRQMVQFDQRLNNSNSNPLIIQSSYSNFIQPQTKIENQNSDTIKVEKKKIVQRESKSIGMNIQNDVIPHNLQIQQIQLINQQQRPSKVILIGNDEPGGNSTENKINKKDLINLVKQLVDKKSQERIAQQYHQEQTKYINIDNRSSSRKDIQTSVSLKNRILKQQQNNRSDIKSQQETRSTSLINKSSKEETSIDSRNIATDLEETKQFKRKTLHKTQDNRRISTTANDVQSQSPLRQKTSMSKIQSSLTLVMQTQNIQKQTTLTQSQQQPVIFNSEINPLLDNYAKKSSYQPCKIQIFHKYDQYEKYRDHPINKIIQVLNSFIVNIIRNKNISSITQGQVINEIRKVNIQLKKGDQVNKVLVRSREFLLLARQQLLNQLFKVINNENEITGTFDISGYNQQLKYYIGRGNNDYLVKQIFRQRGGSWQQLTKKDAQEESVLLSANFFWTQIKKQHIMDNLDCSDIQIVGKSRIFTNCKTYLSQSDSLSTIETENPQKQEQAKQQPSKVVPLRIYGKLENNFHLSNKKALFINMKNYYEALGKDPFDVLPLTFHIKKGIQDPAFKDFKQTHELFSNEPTLKNVWIVKPGENTNRGTGINVCKTVQEVEQIILTEGSIHYSTFIVQKYIEKPLLIKKRKFDIRCYGMMTSINGFQKGYFYQDGYIRTSCKEYNTNNLMNKFIHLTNDAVQKKCEDYGKYENGNKMSFKEFQKYLDLNFCDLSIDFYRDLFPQIKKLVADTYQAVYGKIDPFKRLQSFEVFGYDFMIDEDFKIYLIEVNTNPCLETSCPLLARIISEMLENSMKIAVDPLFSILDQQNIQQQLNNAFNQNQGQFNPSLIQQSRPSIQINGSEGIMQMTSSKLKKQATSMLNDSNIPLFKYELVFDDKIDGPMLRQNVLNKLNQMEFDEVVEDVNEDEVEEDKQSDDEY